MIPAPGFRATNPTMKLTSLTMGAAGAAILASAASAQNIDWASFSLDNSRINASASLGLSDTEEKDYAFADFDQDGYIDLVSVRKQPYTTTGRRANVLFMNEGGTLVDRTAQFAAASDVPGDQGFLTATNDRDVAIGDVNNDGWLDFVTATTFTPNQAKTLSHPRVYINLGESGGVWQGFVHEEARIPNWGTYPNMCGVAIGDVTGDGFADLYFSHYEQEADVDLNDRLLINDGTGFFTDESTARMTSAMRGSSFGTSAVMDDMNGDGATDIISVSGSGATGGLTRSSIAYNNQNNEGFFNLLQIPYDGAPYHVATGDLNADGLKDMILSDDGNDRYLLNEGNDAFGRVSWGAAQTFGTDDGFGSNNYIVDIDGDGFDEAIICDVDVDIPGCGRRLHIFHNRGTVAGSSVQLREERLGSNFGALGLPSLAGVHDIAIFDIDNDGDMDMVVGRCNGTRVYMNNRDLVGTDYCPEVVANSTGQPGDMQLVGSPVAEENDLTMLATNLPADTFGFFIVSQTRGVINQPGGSAGVLCIAGSIGRYVSPGQILNSGTLGEFSLAVDTMAIPQPTTSIPALPGDTFNFTAWYRDSVAGTATSNFADAVSVSFR